MRHEAAADHETVAALLEEILARCNEHALCLASQDYEALTRAVDAQQANIDALGELVGEDRSWLDDASCRRLAKEIDDAGRANAVTLAAAMGAVGDQQRALQKGIKGIAAYTRQAQREDGSFIDRKG